MCELPIIELAFATIVPVKGPNLEAPTVIDPTKTAQTLTRPVKTLLIPSQPLPASPRRFPPPRPNESGGDGEGVKGLTKGEEGVARQHQNRRHRRVLRAADAGRPRQRRRHPVAPLGHPLLCR
jgi:hypothetical protein